MPGEMREAAGASLFVGGLVGGAFGFVLMWGFPASALGWVLFSVCALFAAGSGVSAAAEAA